MDDVLESRLLKELGFAHGFNLRTGGASEAPFDSFNLGRSAGDDPAHVEENHRRFALAVGYEPGHLYETSQVHGSTVSAVGGSEEVTDVRKREADALIAYSGRTAIGVRIADCVPLLLCDEKSGAVAAVHAGWRGTVRGVVEAAARALLSAGRGEPSSLVAAIFPHIRSCCFEVGEDVAQALVAASPNPTVVDRSRPTPHVDLSAIIAAKLRGLGVLTSRIDLLHGCTRCQPERFFSYRRDGQRSGRHLAVVVSR